MILDKFARNYLAFEKKILTNTQRSTEDTEELIMDVKPFLNICKMSVVSESPTFLRSPD